MWEESELMKAPLSSKGKAILPLLLILQIIEIRITFLMVH